jgi:hypothetical protein
MGTPAFAILPINSREFGEKIGIGSDKAEAENLRHPHLGSK